MSERKEHAVSSGVQQLIDRLREDGVQAGRAEAEQLIESAEQKAKQLLADAQQEADRRHSETNEKIRADRKAAEAALELALRDSILRLRDEIAGRIRASVQRIVSEELADREFLRQVILAVAGAEAATVARDEPKQLLVSAEADEFTKGLVTGELREGIEIRFGVGEGGLRIRLQESELEIDLSEESIAALLTRHLLPRWRALMEGPAS